MNVKPEIKKSRLFLGATVFIIGVLSPLLISVVAKTDWSTSLKTTISGLLAIGVPEVFMLIAIAIMGKQGYNYLKNEFFRLIKVFAPADSVSLTRYRIGLIMFSFPIIYSLFEPYINHFFTFKVITPYTNILILDGLFIISLFVLGGDFWDKLRGLFIHKAKIIIED